jgi:hypothetical protein
MQKAVNMMGVLLTAFMLIGALIYGCGTDDLLEENNLRYQTNVSFEDAEESDTLTVDVYQDSDCDDDANTTDPEPFTDLFANITIEIDDATTPGLEMTSYEVSFQPLLCYNNAGNAVNPPSLGTYRGEYDVMIPSASEVEFTITCMEADLKRYLSGWVSPAIPIDVKLRYTVTIRMNFVDEFDEEREITVERTLYFGNYNNC